MTEHVADELPDFPMSRSCPFHPPDQYAALRARAPITRATLPSGASTWLISDYEHARQFLADPRVSANRAHPNYPSTLPRQPVSSNAAKGLLTWMDPPEHTVHRKMLINEFTVKRVQTMRPKIQQITDDCLDDLANGPRPADLVQTLSLPVPSRVICELLGVPYADREVFGRRTITILSRTSTNEQRMGAWGELRAYLDDLVMRKRSAPEDDLLSRLVVKYQEAGLFDRELLAGLAMALLIAGHETTANMISLGTVALLDDPELLAEFRRDTAKAPKAVDELLRYFSIADTSTSRVVAEDMELGGVVLRAGDGVIVLNSAANHDEQVFTAPAEIDLGRETNRHLAFGYGIHQCLGQTLARLELQLVFTSLFARFPGLRLAVPADELSFKHDATFYGINEVPVTW